MKAVCESKLDEYSWVNSEMEETDFEFPLLFQVVGMNSIVVIFESLYISLEVVYFGNLFGCRVLVKIKILLKY